jgi:hypothetical protein
MRLWIGFPARAMRSFRRYMCSAPPNIRVPQRGSALQTGARFRRRRLLDGPKTRRRRGTSKLLFGLHSTPGVDVTVPSFPVPNTLKHDNDLHESLMSVEPTTAILLVVLCFSSSPVESSLSRRCIFFLCAFPCFLNAAWAISYFWNMPLLLASLTNPAR